MRISLFIIVAILASLGRTEQALDILMDNWLAHARDMMNTTENKETSVSGMQFLTPCGALITRMNCTVTADLGVVEDLSTLKRASTVSVLTQSNSTFDFEVSLAYEVLSVHYPNMMIQGPGIRLEYKGIDATVTSEIPFKLSMSLNYTEGVNECTNDFLLTPPSSVPQVTATVQIPKANLPLNSDITTNIVSALVDAATKHISTLIKYEKVCTKLGNLI